MSATFALVLLAWIAVLLLALGLGGLVAHLRDLNERLARLELGGTVPTPDRVDPDLLEIDLPAAPRHFS